MKRSICITLLTLVLFSPAPGQAHQRQPLPLVIDTDAGLDDVVALGLALQCPGLRIAAIVVSEGVLGGQQGVEVVARLLTHFNRREIPIYGPPPGVAARPAPPFRAAVTRTLLQGLPAARGGRRLAFSPDAYRVPAGGQVTVLALGPMGSLARALSLRPDLRKRIARVVASGAPGPRRSWNARFDTGAWGLVARSGVPLEYIVHGPAAAKPRAWSRGQVLPGPATSLLAGLLARLFSAPGVARHYGSKLPRLTDELPLLYLLDPGLFSKRRGSSQLQRVLGPRDARGIIHRFTRIGRDGRQLKQRVVLSGAGLPPANLQPDVRRRRQAIIAKNGEVEWLAQLLQCELHQHLGLYSIIGVKMALRAAELLNAPQHGMQVTSLAPPRPPRSCLNDGLIAGVGSTPGRGLFRVGAPQQRVRAIFSHNGRRATLTLHKPQQQRVERTLRQLRRRHGLTSPRYWAGVRRLGLEVWETWHRTKLFEEQLQDQGPDRPAR